MEKLKNCILNQIVIEEKSMDNILSVFEPLEITKGEFFLKSGKICRQMAFIESGYMRMYDIVDGKEITLWIGSNSKFITSLSSFIFETYNSWNIQAITDCKLYIINRENHFKLSKAEPKWLEFDNILLANSFALLEKSMFSQLHTTAKQRFLSLLDEEPELFKNVPLQFIASMLGITPESLSRLRKMN
ncbi:Crp/Fnr family transcriptional regulator [Cellulophaga sp. HaHaR_3_176]|uniref:Crp/Fnr family transcriptional regulator n=1 Tax=Cellulophaga sp. HaHaR_3_176 TaxID=1942464 RepID=UPI001C1F7353|nr:Crp/Fnr family transcriptional regulator [Cellulophaga sp. HaHaR_3_176]QWX84607.1 Crp/Fnr family transcriptional regulator [Cellulophaga sp. HaHaR_3_176]